MLFSAKELHDYCTRNNSYVYERVFSPVGGRYSYSPPTIADCRFLLKAVREALLSRSRERMADMEIDKWLRPWHVVPKLANYEVPEGDYSIGIEVEYGFQTQDNASEIANVIKDWKYITMDTEGGRNGMEVTFAPTLYSKFGPTSQACRYLKLLASKSNYLVNHMPTNYVGTHVNVSYRDFEGNRRIQNRITAINRLADTRNCYSNGHTPLTTAEQEKYFNRVPYEGLNCYESKYIEFKLFNSVADWKAPRRYVNIAVALTELIRGEEEITRDTLIAALERGYNKKS